MEHKKGFKHTTFGWVPEEWKIKRFGDFAEFKNGLNYSKDEEGKGLKIIGVGDFKDNFEIQYDSLQEISKINGVPESYLLRDGDILFVRSNGNKALIGRAIFIDNVSESITHSGFTIRARIVDKSILPVFAALLFKTGSVKQQIQTQGGGTNISNLSQDLLHNLEFPLPPLPEQRAIAAILRACDDTIEKTQALLAALRRRHTGLLQALLTGKKRVKGFEREKWDRVRLGEVFEFLKTESLSRECLTSEKSKDKIQSIHYGDIHTIFKGSYLDLETENRLPFVKDDFLPGGKLTFLEDGDLIMADASEDYEGLCECFELKNIGDKKVVAGLHTFALRENQSLFALGFRTHIFKNFEVSVAIKKNATGTSVYGISKSNLSKIEIPLPSLPEQRAITAILQSSEAEIRGYEQQLALLQRQKKGLMQVLLTGRVRVKNPGEKKLA